MADDQITMVKQANDIVEVIGEYVPLRKHGRVYKGLCPFHDDHNPSFDVDPARQRYRCWACGKFGDVISFVQERERVDFREALELLARRANIELKRGGDGQGRARMLDLMKWAEEQYHRYLLDAATAAPARAYLAARRLTTDTIRGYRLGYAPAFRDWLTQRALRAGWPEELLVAVGLSGRREGERALYDRFRDRVIFPIRDVRGRTVGFGGRILPSSPHAAAAPKYYNSSDTPLFSKSEHLYGLDQARAAGVEAGYLAVVEGYTDVLMAHQLGILPVVATLGTALNARHIAQLRRFVPKVILVFDADAGGARGVDQALELFVSQDVELAIATLPEGLDPCDLLVQRGPEPFLEALRTAVDALEFKLQRTFTPERMATVDGKRAAIDEVLKVLALAPELTGQAGQVKRQLMVTRIAQHERVGIDIKTVWERLQELRKARRPAPRAGAPKAADPRPAAAPDRIERELLELVLAHPEVVPKSVATVGPEEIDHPGLRRLLQEIYALHREGQKPDVDRVRARLADKPELAEAALRLQHRGLANTQPDDWLASLGERFAERRLSREKQALQGQLRSAAPGGPPPVDILRQWQEKNRGRSRG